MTTLLAGMASGVLMAKFFILIGSLTAFAALRNPTPGLTALMERFPPGGLVIALVIIAYPVWTIIGIILALVFVALQNGVPGGGLGSPNIAYTCRSVGGRCCHCAPARNTIQTVLACARRHVRDGSGHLRVAAADSADLTPGALRVE